MDAYPHHDVPSQADALNSSRRSYATGGQERRRPQGLESAEESAWTRNSPNELRQFGSAPNSLQGVQALARKASDRRSIAIDSLEGATADVRALRTTLARVQRGADCPNTIAGIAQQGPQSVRTDAQLENRPGFSQEVITRLPASNVDILKTPESEPDSRQTDLLPTHGLLDQAGLSGQVETLGTGLETLSGKEAHSTIDAIRSGARMFAGGGVGIGSQPENRPLSRSIAMSSDRLQDGITDGDFLDSMLIEVATKSRDVERDAGIVDHAGTVGRSNQSRDLTSGTAAEEFLESHIPDRNPPADELTGLQAGSVRRDTASIEADAALGRLRRKAKAGQEPESILGRSPPYHDLRSNPSTIIEAKGLEPVASDRESAPVRPRPEPLQQGSPSSLLVSPKLEYEIRRILVGGNRLPEANAWPGFTRLLASPLPNPRTRM